MGFKDSIKQAAEKAQESVQAAREKAAAETAAARDSRVGVSHDVERRDELGTTPLMAVTSHDRDQKNATVRIYSDRLELARIGISSSAKAALATFTMGASLLSKRGRGGQEIQHEILFLHPQTQVKTDSDGMGWTIVTVQTPTGSMSFRITRAEAERARLLITELARKTTVGVMPMVQAVAPPPAPPSPALAAAAGTSMVDELARLGELHKTGVLSAEEFAAAKARLLGGE